MRTNNPVCGAFRGFGANQAQFATEGCLDRLAELVGISGWEIRKRNVIRPGEVWGPGQIMDDGVAGAEACLDAIRDRLRRERAAGRGGRARPRPEELGPRQRLQGGHRCRASGSRPTARSRCWHGWTEMGQGVHTVALQVAAEELGVDPDRIRVIVDTTPRARPRPDHRFTRHADGRRRREGGVRCRAGRRLRARTSTTWASTGSTGPTSSARPASRNPIIHSAFSYAAQLVVIDRDDRRDRAGRRGPRRRPGGEPAAVRGPDRGLGAHGPRLRAHRGLPVRPRDRVPDQHDPAVAGDPAGQGRARRSRCSSSRSRNRGAPYGIKGVGEIGLVPTAPAVAAALHDLDGVWRTTLADAPRRDRRMTGTRVTAKS